MDPLQHALAVLGSGRDLSADEAHDAVATIVDGDASDVAIAAFLTALRVKGETADELAGAARAVAERMTVLDGDFPPLLDTCGTGGDGANTINVSTATALITAACGVPVAKHGNRSASGNSGSAEVLTELGVNIEADPEILKKCLYELNITFLFAPRFHPALRSVGPVRKRLPFRTLFNLLGPLVNPARPLFQLIGVPDEARADLVAAALAGSGRAVEAVVVSGSGLDEVTLAGPTSVRRVSGGRVESLTWTPADFSLPAATTEPSRVSGPFDSAARLRRLLAGEPGPDRDLVLANTAAALWIAHRVDTLPRGLALAAGAIDSGTAAHLLDRWARLSRGEGPA